ncbi:MAG: HpcH/HpaI aldolase/citrate lyase family protein [Pseudomonadota bacterium]|nr:HpcH/HpaI aldolase/citrate lyase family protein [Pseudomonadota bacterium]
MDLPVNAFKRALLEGRTQIGLWSALCSNIAAEVLADSGFDWILIDAEHAPNDVASVLVQLQVMAAGQATPIVRLPWNDTVMIKRYLDIGTQSFLIPMVQNADEARQAVAATRYPPHGLRGVSVGPRANRYGRVKDYFHQAQRELCVLVQVETRQALTQIEAIAAVEGVDGVFIGPSDLSADMGFLGDSGHAEVRRAIEDAVARIRAAGKPAGILTGVEADARHWLQQGCTFVAVGSDLGLLARQSEALAARFKQNI